METLLQIILPTLILPLLLTVIVYWLTPRFPFLQWSLPLVWLPSYIWISGLPAIPPTEAKEWLWILPCLSIMSGLLFKTRLHFLIAVQTLLLALILIAISFPVLQYQFSLQLIIELIVMLIISFAAFSLLLKTKTSLQSPTLSLTVSGAGLAVIVSMAGSLLLGQLAGVIAMILSVCILYKYFYNPAQPLIISNSILTIMQIYFAILMISRIYAELPLAITFLLLLAPLPGLIPKLRYAFVYSATTIIIAISWLMFTTDSSSYY